MIDPKALLADLQKLLTQLEDDLRRRCQALPDVDAPLRAQYAAAREANRTAQAYDIWRDEQITQAAVAWILGCVFVRFCEDNALIDPPRLSGPGERRQRAEDEHTLYFQRHPAHSDREYLLWVFDEVAKLPAMKELFDHRHNPLWSIQVTGDGAMALRAFFLRRNPTTGLLVHDFSDPAFVSTQRPVPSTSSPDPTRFLGDLYQDLSESTRKKYALLQTPIFVEEFILDRTLEPAIREFGFRHVKMIDPTCGSGHFLLGGFRRLFHLWVKHEPNTNVRKLAQNALDSVVGVDLNPFAVAIARFRLMVAALSACGIARLADAPAFTIHLAAGDSLLHGARLGRTGRQEVLIEDEDDETRKHHYQTEDADKLARYLGQQYHAVVGNPPYITPKDKALNEAYRDRFDACHRQYSLAVPFFQRFIDLTLGSVSPSPGTPGEGRGEGASPGFFGMITANSFMKREFGKKLIEQKMRLWDVTHIVDTSGAYIPGHGTPTVIIFGQHRRPVTTTIRTAMGIAGEPSTPDDPARGLVWTSITSLLDQPGSQSKYVSVADTDREAFNTHPWSIGGGGAAALKETLDDEAASGLADACDEIGYIAMTRADELYFGPHQAWRRLGVESRQIATNVEGDKVRDWAITEPDGCLFPYDETLKPAMLSRGFEHVLWPHRTHLWLRREPNGSHVEIGLTWFEWSRFQRARYLRPLAIAFGFVATHNHFVLDRGGKVFKQSAPVIKLKADASEDDHLGLLGLLNSSTACFWMKQIFFPKGGDHVGTEGARVRRTQWDERYEFASTGMESYPLPEGRPLALARRLDALARAYAASLPDAVCRGSIPKGSTLAAARERATRLRGQMIALQEELDWQCYPLYRLLGDDAGTLTRAAAGDGELPTLRLGQRAFEIVLARQMAAGEVETTWFARHKSTPITEIPADWPADYRQVVQRRIDTIAADKNIALIERPEYKRRWNDDAWEELQKNALRGWLLDRLEGWEVAKDEGGRMKDEAVERKADAAAGSSFSPQHSALPDHPSSRSVVWDDGEPRVMSVAQLADRLRQNSDFMQVAALFRGREDFDLTKLVAELVEDEAVPFLPVLRYKESGLRNRRVWEQVWHLQREEDAIDTRTKLPPTDPQYLTEQQAKAEKKAKVGDIPVPPKYKLADMASGTIWRLRGKLDVPKERFVSFPHCQRDADPTLPITWAGYDHLQQMQALAAYYMDAKEREGWPADRRVPLLAGMLELLPWVLQWHNDVDPAHQLRMGDYYRDFINDEAREMGKTAEQIKAWTPPAKAGGRGRKKAGD